MLVLPQICCICKLVHVRPTWTSADVVGMWPGTDEAQCQLASKSSKVFHDLHQVETLADMVSVRLLFSGFNSQLGHRGDTI